MKVDINFTAAAIAALGITKEQLTDWLQAEAEQALRREEYEKVKNIIEVLEEYK